MSGQSSQQKSNGSLYNNYQPDRLPPSIGSPQQLPQFTAATAPGYQPQPQTKSTTYSTGSSLSSNSTTTSLQANSDRPKSEFAASFYASGDNYAKAKYFLPPAAQPVDGQFKGFKFVTLDQFQIETRDIYDQISGTYQWEMCESQEDRCKEFIRDKCADRRVFLVTSGSLGKQIVPAIHNLSQVYAIYIYCSDVKYHLEWTKEYPKVRAVCNNDDEELLPQLAVDVAQANLDWGNTLLKDNKRDAAKQKFEKALTNLTTHAKRPDPSMVNQVKSKLEECK